MNHESGALQSLGVNTQLVDYFSKQYVATLVSFTHDPQTAHSSQQRFKSAVWH